MRRNKLALCLYLVWTTDEQDASAPAPAGARPQARQGRCQSLVREELNEDFLFSSALRCRPMIVAGDDPI